LPERKHNPDYVRHPVPQEMIIPDYYGFGPEGSETEI
jgi:hypothetical protein